MVRIPQQRPEAPRPQPMYTLHVRRLGGSVEVLIDPTPDALLWCHPAQINFAPVRLTAREVIVVRDYLINERDVAPDQIYATLVT